MGLKTSLGGATFQSQSIMSYGVASYLRAKSKDFFTDNDVVAGSGNIFLRPPLSTVWAGQVRMHWLPYFGGYVTAMRLRDAPILTGKMSGCPLAIFNHLGALHFGHIGTVDDQEPGAADKNRAVKASWNAAVARGTIQPLMAWSPAGDIGATNPQGEAQVFGVASPQSKVYSLRATYGHNSYTIADILNGTAFNGRHCVRNLLASKGV